MVSSCTPIIICCLVLLRGLSDCRKSETGEQKTREISKKNEAWNEKGNKIIAPVKVGDKKEKQWETSERDDKKKGKGKVKMEKAKKGKIKTQKRENGVHSINRQRGRKSKKVRKNKKKKRRNKTRRKKKKRGRRKTKKKKKKKNHPRKELKFDNSCDCGISRTQVRQM
jgi:hypothetical protein